MRSTRSTRLRSIALSVGIFSVLTLTACEVTTTKSLDVEEGEKIIHDYMEDTYEDLPVGEVECPEREIKKDDVFTCTGDLGGKPLKFEVTQTSDEGDINAEPTQAVIKVAAAKAFVEEAVGKETGGPATVDCGPDELLIKDVGSTIECPVTDSDGQAGTAVMTVKDVEGNVDLTFE